MTKIRFTGIYPVVNYFFDKIKSSRRVEKIDKSNKPNNYKKEENNYLGVCNEEESINNWSIKSLRRI